MTATSFWPLAGHWAKPFTHTFSHVILTTRAQGLVRRGRWVGSARVEASCSVPQPQEGTRTEPGLAWPGAAHGPSLHTAFSPALRPQRGLRPSKSQLDKTCQDRQPRGGRRPPYRCRPPFRELRGHRAGPSRGRAHRQLNKLGPEPAAEGPRGDPGGTQMPRAALAR